MIFKKIEFCKNEKKNFYFKTTFNHIKMDCVTVKF